MIDPKFTKPVSSVLTVQSESNTLKTVQNSDLKFTLCDRNDTSNKKGHYFVSFGLPATSTMLTTGSTLSLYYPELYQLNVDQAIIIPIPGSYYSEFIDGRSITLKVPQTGSTTQTSLSSITLYSSTYTSDKVLRNETSLLLGDNIVYLFCDTINRPFSGNTVDEMGTVTSRAANTTWEPDSTNFLRRPSAVSYKEVKGTSLINGFNSDTRGNTSFSARVPSNYPENRAGYNYDIPVGFCVLDKGFLVLTHTAITTNFLWSAGYNSLNVHETAPILSGRTNIYFTGTTDGTAKAAVLTFKDINTSFKMSTVCLAMPKEFYISNNPTWNREKALSEINNQTGIINVDPVYITEIGLYNAFGELVAVAKTSEPVAKDYTSLLTFNVDIEL